MVGVLLIVLVVGVVSGFAAAAIAGAKGYNQTGYFILGFFLPLLGILVAGFMPPAEPSEDSSVDPTVRRLAELRSSSDPRVADFLDSYQEILSSALRYCDVGEHVLAFGNGTWQEGPIYFLLTDRRFVFTRPPIGRTPSSTQVVTRLDRFTLEGTLGELRSPEGVLTPAANAPFTASELQIRIHQRQVFDPYVEVVSPWSSALPKPPEPDGSAVIPVQPVADTVSELERLDALHRSGVIDDDEFAELKRRLVWGDEGPTESSG